MTTVIMLALAAGAFLEMGCPPAREDLAALVFKSFEKSGCQGCKPEEPEGEGEIEGEGESGQEGEGESEGEQEGEGEGEGEGEEQGEGETGPPRYTLTYLAGPNGTIAGASPQIIPRGGDGALVTATPDAGFHFTGWSDGSLTATRQDVDVVKDITVTAQFSVNMYEITCIVSGKGTCVAEPAEVPHGGTSTISITPDPGWRILSSVDSEEGLKPDSYTTTPVTANRVVTVAFTINQYTLTYLAGTGGTLQGMAVQTVAHGADGTAITAYPEDGYAFTQWSDGNLSPMRQDTGITADLAVTAVFAPSAPPWINSFSVNSGTVSTPDTALTLHNSCAGGPPAEYMASEAADFRDADWQPYTLTPTYIAKGSAITRTIYFKVRNGMGESGIAQDSIYLLPETVPVSGGAFTMGRRDDGDDRIYGSDTELPRHEVTLGAYQAGRYEVTNRQFCDVLNWAAAKGYLYRDVFGLPWSGSGPIYAGGDLNRHVILAISSSYCNITFLGGIFEPKTRTGLPESTIYSMADHPAVGVSWFGAAAFCNWLSEMAELTPCYNMSTGNWRLTLPPPTAGGYRLPTEAEWERAAAWDTPRHWAYPFMSDNILNKNWCNYYNGITFNNPLGLLAKPYTSPAGWFNGVNVSPNGNAATANSASPVGAFDMGGNVAEWCHDWFGAYSKEPQENPTGPAVGEGRVLRGGSWNSLANHCRASDRGANPPQNTYNSLGFRVVRTP